MYSSTLYLSAALATIVNAQANVYRGTTALGSPYGGMEDNQQSRQRVVYANQHPNATKSFDFNPFYVDGVFNGGTASPDTDNTWTLRINVSDFSVPNAQQPFPGEQPPFVNPHVTNTVMELGWHENETWRSALNGSTGPFCLKTNTGRFLPNVTNKFTEDNTSGDCTPVLGEACVKALLQSSQNLDRCDFSLWTDIPECASMLGASTTYDEYGLAPASLNLNGIDSNNFTRPHPAAANSSMPYDAVAHGQDGRFAIFSQSTDAYNGTNTTLYEQAATELHVVLMAISPFQNASAEQSSYGGLWSQKLMCVRADTSKVEEDGSSGGGGGGSGGGSGSGSGGNGNGNGDSDENAAATMTSGLGAAGVTVGLGAVWLGMFALL